MIHLHDAMWQDLTYDVIDYDVIIQLFNNPYIRNVIAGGNYACQFHVKNSCRDFAIIR